MFELRCPAPERFDEAWLDRAQLGELEVRAIAIDDCDFQQMILAQILSQLGLPEARVRVLGGDAADLQNVTERIVGMLNEIPSDAHLLAIVDENLDLPEPWSVTVSGSYAIQQAREQLSAAQEARLLALVRSANDSADDVRPRACTRLPDKVPQRAGSEGDPPPIHWTLRRRGLRQRQQAWCSCHRQ